MIQLSARTEQGQNRDITGRVTEQKLKVQMEVDFSFNAVRTQTRCSDDFFSGFFKKNNRNFTNR